MRERAGVAGSSGAAGPSQVAPNQVGPTQVMGVINVTPDSFSDGGQWLDPRDAIARGRELLDEGASILDIGGESTRPGAGRIDAARELERIIPVITGLKDAGARVSVDTMRSEVARRALDAGASIINDVSGAKADPKMAELAAERGCPLVLSHWRGPSEVMTGLAEYDDVVPDVIRELTAQVDRVRAAGVKPEQLILDPGLGFAKDAQANWEIIARVEEFLALGYPVLVGASRKRFLGELLSSHGGHETPTDRDQATAAVTAILADRGVWGVRVHAVSPSVDAILVAEAIKMAKNGAMRRVHEEPR